MAPGRVFVPLAASAFPASPSVPYLFNLRMGPMEKMDPESHEWGYIGCMFFAKKMCAPQWARPCLAEHLKGLQAYPPRHAADTLNLHNALENAMNHLRRSGSKHGTDGLY